MSDADRVAQRNKIEFWTLSCKLVSAEMGKIRFHIPMHIVSLFHDEQPNGVYRRDGERYSKSNISKSNCYGNGFTIVWSRIDLKDCTGRMAMNGGNLAAERYIKDIQRK